MLTSRRTFLASALTALATSRWGRAGQRRPTAEEPDWSAGLARHRIKSVELRRVRMRWPRLVGKNARLDVHGHGPTVSVCRLRTDRGVSGWGTVHGSRKTVKALRDRVTGRRVTDLFDPTSGIKRGEYAPLDFALHDLAGMILKLPVYQLLGGGGPKTAPCYSGMIYFDGLEPPENPAGIAKVLENCQADYDRGYRQLKVKIGRGNKWMPPAEGLQRDIDVTRAIAQEFPDVTILVDGNDGFSGEELQQYLEGIGDVKLYWIEEPFREDVEDYARLDHWLRRHKRQTYLADGEANPDWTVLSKLIEKDLLDVHVVDIVGYGLTAWRQLMPELQRQQVLASPHCWGHLLKTHYVSHLAAGLGNVCTIEGVTCSSDEVDFGDYPLEEGQLTVSDAPGFGMRLLV